MMLIDNLQIFVSGLKVNVSDDLTTFWAKLLSLFFPNSNFAFEFSQFLQNVNIFILSVPSKILSSLLKHSISIFQTDCKIKIKPLQIFRSQKMCIWKRDVDFKSSEIFIALKFISVMSLSAVYWSPLLADRLFWVSRIEQEI